MLTADNLFAIQIKLLFTLVVAAKSEDDSLQFTTAKLNGLAVPRAQCSFLILRFPDMSQFHIVLVPVLGHKDVKQE